MSRIKAVVVGVLTAALIASGGGVAHASEVNPPTEQNPICDLLAALQEGDYPWKDWPVPIWCP